MDRVGLTNNLPRLPHLFFYLFLPSVTSIFLSLHHFHTPPRCLASLTTAFLAFVPLSILFKNLLSCVYPPSFTCISTSPVFFVPSPFRYLCIIVLYPRSPCSTVPSETIPPPFLIFLHPPLPLLLMRNHNLSPVA